MDISLTTKEFLYVLSIIKNKDPTTYTDMDKHLLKKGSILRISRLEKLRTKLIRNKLDELLAVKKDTSKYRKLSVQFQMLCTEEITIINDNHLSLSPQSIYILKQARQMYHPDKINGDVSKFHTVQQMYLYAKQN